MPIYEFRCQECGEKVEILLPMGNRNLTQACPNCQNNMSRLVELPHAAILVGTGRDQVLGSLNSKDDGIGNKPHIKNAMWKGLNQRGPIIGRGFG